MGEKLPPTKVTKRLRSPGWWRLDQKKGTNNIMILEGVVEGAFQPALPLVGGGAQRGGMHTGGGGANGWGRTSSPELTTAYPLRGSLFGAFRLKGGRNTQ